MFKIQLQQQKMNSLRTTLVIAVMCLLMAIAPSCALQTSIHPTSARLQRPFVAKYQSPQRPLFPESTYRSRKIQLSSSTFDGEDSPPYFKGDSLVLDTSRSLRRISWFSWWSQVILTCVSSVIILFARNVVKVADKTQSLGTDGFFLAGSCKSCITCLVSRLGGHVASHHTDKSPK